MEEGTSGGRQGPLWLLYKPLGAMSPGPFLPSIQHIQLKNYLKRKKSILSPAKKYIPMCLALQLVVFGTVKSVLQLQ